MNSFRSSARRAALAAFLLASASGASAATVTVDCVGGTGDFTSVSAALASLAATPPPLDWDYIYLKSDCTENVTVSAGLRVWIAPEWDPLPWSCCTTGGPRAMITAANAGAPVLAVDGASVSLIHVQLSGGTSGLTVTNGSATAYGMLAEGASGRGIIVGAGGNVSMYEGGSQQNGSVGIFVDNGGRAALAGQQSWLSNVPLVVSDNAGAGLWVDRGVLLAWAGTRIEDNAGPGIVGFGGDVSFGTVAGDALISHNQGGIYLSEGSEATLWTDATILDNGTYGVYAEKGSHASLWQAHVQNHAGFGVDAVTNSQVSLHQGTQVIGNGTLGHPDTGGVRVDGTSNAYLDGGSTVTGNLGAGVVVDLGSSLDVRDASIATNSAEGVRLLHMSVANLSADSVLDPNDGGDVACDRTSLAISTLKLKGCKGDEKPSQPRPIRPPQP